MGKLPDEFLFLEREYKHEASYKFEEICGELMQAQYGNAHRIVPRQGDLGIDIIIGDFSSPCTICQCKFFTENIKDSQKAQIRDSFNRAVNVKEYSMKKWVLFLANDMDPPEFEWWSHWQAKQVEQYKIEIELYEGTSLISLLKEYKVYDRFFGKQVNCSLHKNTLGSFGSSGLFLISDEVVNAHSVPRDSRMVRAFQRIAAELENILYAVCSDAAKECILKNTSLTLVDYLAREINGGSQMILLLGNGGIGKTTALVQTAVRMRDPNKIVYLLQLGKPQNQDVAALEKIRQSIVQNRGQDLTYNYLLFIDNAYANSEILGDFLDEIQFDENVQIIISERLNRFSSIAEDLLRGMYQQTLRTIKIGFQNDKSVIPFAHSSQVVRLEISALWKQQIVLDMFRSIPGVDISKIESVIGGKRDMSIIELYLRTCIKYNKLVDSQESLSTTLVRVNLDWDEWINQVRAARYLSPQESKHLESVFQIVAALDIFKVKASLKMLSHKTEIPEDRLDYILHSLLSTVSYEPMWYENSGDEPYLKLKHDVISYLYFEEKGISPQITLESLIGTLRDSETIINFEKQVFKRKYIQRGYGSSPPLKVNIKRLYELFDKQESFYAVLSHANRAYSFDIARIWMIDVRCDGGALASKSWEALLQDYKTSEPMLRRKVYLCCRDDCQRRNIPFPKQLLEDKNFQYIEAFEAAKAKIDTTQIASIWNNKFEYIYQTTMDEKNIVHEWRKGIFDYILLDFEMPRRFFDVLNHVSYQTIDYEYTILEPFVQKNRLNRRRYYDLGISLYTAIAKRNPGDIPSRMHLAYCYEHLGNYRQAELTYEEILHDHSRQYTVYNALASLCAQWLRKEWEMFAEDLEERQRVTTIFETSVRKSIDLAKNDMDKARSYAVWGMYLFRTVYKAQESYDILKIGLNYFELRSLHIELGMLCSKFTRSNPCYSIEEAEKHFNRALEMNCRPIERLSVYVPYGNMLYCIGRLQEAAAQFQKASKLGESKADQMVKRIQRESQILEKVVNHRPHLITTLWDALEEMKSRPKTLFDIEKKLDIFSLLLDAVSDESIENASYSLISLIVRTLNDTRYPQWKEDLIRLRVIQKAEEYCAKDSFYTKRAQDNFRSQCFFINHSIKVKQGNEYDLLLEKYEVYLRDTSHVASLTD